MTDRKRKISLAEAKKKNPDAEIGTEILATKPTDVLGRIAAQTAKQVILQKVREAERGHDLQRVSHPRGRGWWTVIGNEPRARLIVDMGRTEARAAEAANNPSWKPTI